MSKIEKKEVREFLDKAIAQVLRKFKISTSPKRIEKITKTFSKKFAEEVRDYLKKRSVKATKVQKTPRKEPRRRLGQSYNLKDEGRWGLFSVIIEYQVEAYNNGLAQALQFDPDQWVEWIRYRD